MKKTEKEILEIVAEGRIIMSKYINHCALCGAMIPEDAFHHCCIAPTIQEIKLSTEFKEAITTDYVNELEKKLEKVKEALRNIPREYTWDEAGRWHKSYCQGCIVEKILKEVE